MVFVTSVATGADNGAKLCGSSAAYSAGNPGLMSPRMLRNTSIGAVGDRGFRKGRHAVMQRAGKPQDRQRQRRARSLAEPQIKVEQRPLLERVEHQAVPLPGRAMRKNKVRTVRRGDTVSS